MPERSGRGWCTMAAAIVLAVSLMTIAVLGPRREGTSAAAGRTSPAWSPTSADAGGATELVGPVTYDFRIRLDSLQEIVAADPQNASARLELARILHDAHRLPEAIEHYEILAARDPGATAVRLDLAQAHAQLEHWHKAAGIMERVLDQDAENAAILYNLGAIAANRGDRTAASEWWNRMLDLEGHSVFDKRARASLAQLEKGRRDDS